MSKWAELEGKIYTTNINAINVLMEKSRPKEYKGLEGHKIYPCIYFHGSEGGAKFYHNPEPDFCHVVDIDANLRDCDWYDQGSENLWDQYVEGFEELIKDLHGQGYLVVNFGFHDVVIIEHYESLKVTVLSNPETNFRNFVEVKEHGT